LIKFRSIWEKFWCLPRQTAAFLVLFYQKTLSPDHGLFRNFFPHGYCKYYPSCSEYTRRAILKHGLVWGILKGAWRILRCNPWSKGGEDNP